MVKIILQELAVERCFDFSFAYFTTLLVSRLAFTGRIGRIWKEEVVTYSRYDEYFGIRPKVLSKSMKPLTHDTCCHGSSRAPHERKFRQFLCSIIACGNVPSLPGIALFTT
jgi:hypothetical protein